jgi:aryl-alcohol dehydrogenase-like predicted oxidoreductase
LTGRFGPQSRIKGIRAADSEFMGPRFQRNLDRVARLTAIAARRGRTVAQLAIQWVLRHPGVSAVIVGARRPSQIEQDVGGDGWDLSPDDLAEIDRVMTEA